MILTMQGDLLAQQKGHIIHGCNCQGKMGSGVAKLIRDKWPEVYEEYRAIYTEHGLQLGQAMPIQVTDDLVVWNLMTQEFYKGHPETATDQVKFVSYDAIEHSLLSMQVDIAQYFPDIEPTIHLPLIGAGLGGGNWKVINSIIDNTVQDSFDKNLWIYDK